jgi:hypothetical protein
MLKSQLVEYETYYVSIAEKLGRINNAIVKSIA